MKGPPCHPTLAVPTVLSLLVATVSLTPHRAKFAMKVLPCHPARVQPAPFRIFLQYVVMAMLTLN